jgi:hypothetical protein
MLAVHAHPVEACAGDGPRQIRAGQHLPCSEGQGWIGGEGALESVCGFERHYVG